MKAFQDINLNFYLLFVYTFCILANNFRHLFFLMCFYSILIISKEILIILSDILIFATILPWENNRSRFIVISADNVNIKYTTYMFVQMKS